MRIGLRPFGELPAVVIDELVPVLEEFGTVKRLPPAPILSEWFDPEAGKFEADCFLDALRDEPLDRVLGLTAVDLFARDYNFVFGQARIMGRPAVVSIARLGKPSTELFRERLAKEAVHELGHTLGIGHCENRECVMRFSNTLAETDRKTRWFCRVCRATVDFTAKRLRGESGP